MVTLVLLRIILVLLLVAANAFFVAAEFAMVSVRDTRIQQLIEQRRIGARTVRKIQQRLDEFLPAVQFGVTLASLGLGWVGEGTLARIIEPWLGGIPYARVYAHGLAGTHGRLHDHFSSLPSAHEQVRQPGAARLWLQAAARRQRPLG